MCPCGWYSACFQGCNEAQIEVRKAALAHLTTDQDRQLQLEFQQDFEEDKEGDQR